MQGDATLMSVDYAVARGAFVMDFSILWRCDPIDCSNIAVRTATAS